jgi:hypothetical protein
MARGCSWARRSHRQARPGRCSLPASAGHTCVSSRHGARRGGHIDKRIETPCGDSWLGGVATGGIDASRTPRDPPPLLTSSSCPFAGLSGPSPLDAHGRHGAADVRRNLGVRHHAEQRQFGVDPQRTVLAADQDLAQVEGLRPIRLHLAVRRRSTPLLASPYRRPRRWPGQAGACRGCSSGLLRGTGATTARRRGWCVPNSACQSQCLLLLGLLSGPALALSPPHGLPRPAKATARCGPARP